MQPNGEEIVSDLDATPTEDAARIRFRQRRALNFALSAVTVAAIVVGASLVIRNNQHADDGVGSPLGASGPAPTTTAPAITTAPTTTTPATTTPAVVSAPTSESAPRTSNVPQATTTSTTQLPAPAATPPDLHATAPSSVARL